MFGDISLHIWNLINIVLIPESDISVDGNAQQPRSDKTVSGINMQRSFWGLGAIGLTYHINFDKEGVWSASKAHA